MKTSDSLRITGTLGASLVKKDAPSPAKTVWQKAEVSKEGTGDRHQAAIDAWEKRHAAGEGGTKVGDANEMGIGLKKAHENAKLALTAIEGASDSQSRHVAAGYFMEAQRHLQQAQRIAGHYGGAEAAGKFVDAQRKIALHIDRMFGQKLDKPETDAIDSIKHHVNDGMESALHGAERYTNLHLKDGGGAIPHTPALHEFEGSRTHEFVGGVEMRLKRDDLRNHLKEMGYGRVDLASDAGSKPGASAEHELWEHPDGRSVRITHRMKDDGMQALTIKERAKDRWKATRREFARDYHGNAALNDPDAKPAKPPAGHNVGLESEVPLMPKLAPKKR